MKKGNIYEGIVKKVEFPNKAYVEVIEKDENGNEQKTLTIVKGALPGQKIKFRAKKVRKDKSQGILLEVTEKSPLETAEPMCSRFGKCGGCSYQTLPYEKQLELKRNQVLEIIDNVYKTLDSSLGIKKDYIYKLCSSNEAFLRELLRILSNKALNLSSKLKQVTMKSIREMICNYLLKKYNKEKSTTIKLEFSRKDWADKLGVQRPSLSRELMKMRDAGLIDFSKNIIEIKDLEGLKGYLL